MVKRKNVCTLHVSICLPFFTVQCYAECGIATASQVSVLLSMTLRYCEHISWNSKYSKIIQLVRLGCSLFADPNNMDLLLREHSEIFTGIGVGYAK